MQNSVQLRDDMPELLTIRELATILKVSQRSIWRLVASGQLVEPLRVGGSIRWRRDDIRDWIIGGCEKASNKPR
jgi:excisionase family DNA binding protein